MLSYELAVVNFPPNGRHCQFSRPIFFSCSHKNLPCALIGPFQQRH